MQKKINDLKQKKNNARYTGEAGGGLVKVTIDGNYDLQEINFSEELKDEELSIIGDLVIAAYNNAKGYASDDEELSEGDLLKDFPLPFNMKNPPF